MSRWKRGGVRRHPNLRNASLYVLVKRRELVIHLNVLKQDVEIIYHKMMIPLIFSREGEEPAAGFGTALAEPLLCHEN